MHPEKEAQVADDVHDQFMAVRELVRVEGLSIPEAIEEANAHYLREEQVREALHDG